MSAERVHQLIEAGLWLRMSGDHEGAKRLFAQALKLDPENARARELLGPTGEGAEDLPVEFRARPGRLPGPAEIVNFHRPEPRQASTPPALHPETRTDPFGLAPASVPPRTTTPPPPTRPAAMPPMPSMPAVPSVPAVTPLVPPAQVRPSPPPFEATLPASPPHDAEGGASDGWDWDQEPALVVQPVRGTGRDAMDVLSDSAPAPFLQPISPPPARPVQGEDVPALLQKARDRIGLDDHSGALALVQKALALDPKSAEALRLRDQSERTLAAMYESKLGSLDQRPRVLLREDEVIWLNLDHRAGFVLAQIDGTVSYEDVFLVSGMSRLDTLRILAELKAENVIG